MNPTLSVIIPVYKVEAYLKRCVNSVLNQDYRDLEVILVDDGSPDRCPQICDDFAEKDSRVSVFHKSNGGLSSARNAGIEKATGKYIAFLDSDDQWNTNHLKYVMGELLSQNSDFILFGSFDVYDTFPVVELKHGDSNAQDYSFSIMNAVDYYSFLIKTGGLREQAGTKIYDAEFLKANSLYFKPGIISEDNDFMIRLLRVAKSVIVTDVPLYAYTRARKGSITTTASTKSIKDLLGIIEDGMKYNEVDNAISIFEREHCAYLWSICMGYYSRIPNHDKLEVKLKLIEIKKYLVCHMHPKAKKVFKIYNLLGFTITVQILGLYMWLHRHNFLNKKVIRK